MSEKKLLTYPRGGPRLVSESEDTVDTTNTAPKAAANTLVAAWESARGGKFPCYRCGRMIARLIWWHPDLRAHTCIGATNKLRTDEEKK